MTAGDPSSRNTLESRGSDVTQAGAAFFNYPVPSNVGSNCSGGDRSRMVLLTGPAITWNSSSRSSGRAEAASIIPAAAASELEKQRKQTPFYFLGENQ